MSLSASSRTLAERIPGLDGLRAMTALAVYAHHVANPASGPGHRLLSKLVYFTGVPLPHSRVKRSATISLSDHFCV